MQAGWWSLRRRTTPFAVVALAIIVLVTACASQPASAFNPPGRVSNLVASVASVSNLNLGSGAPTVTTTWGAPVNLGGSLVTGYEGRTCVGNCDEPDPAWVSAKVVSLGITSTWLTPCPADQITCSYQVRAVNAVGPGAWGPSVRLTPFAVTNVVAVSAAPAGYVAVGWTGPAEVGAGIDHIALYLCLTTSGCSNSANWSDTGLTIIGNPHLVVHNCGQGVSCTYKVVAVGSGGAVMSGSSAATAASGSTLPDAPSALGATSHQTTLGAVNLSWTAPANSGSFPVNDYVFQRSVNGGSFSSDISTGAVGTTYLDTSCGATNACTYKVAAVTFTGTGSYSTTATASGAGVPSAPFNLNATPGGTFGEVDINWKAPVSNYGNAVAGYTLQRSLDGGGTWPLTASLGTSLSYSDSTCGVGTSCTYRVAAVNSVGAGPNSNTSTAIGTNLSPPQSLTATTAIGTLGGVLLSWSPPASDSGFLVQGYEFRYKVGAGAFSAYASTGTGTGTAFTHLCGQDGTCTYEVRAFNAIGPSSPSNQAAAKVATVSLGTSANYSVLGATTVTNTGASSLALSLGVSPGTSLTGFSAGMVLGTTDTSNAAVVQAHSDLAGAYENAASRPITATTATANLDDLTLQSGVYAAPGLDALTLNTTLTLDGAGDPNAVFIIRTNTTVITGAGSTVSLINGAQACNVFWQVGSSATLGASSVFFGNILAQTSITVGAGVTVHGRALAVGAAVTLDTDTFTSPTCATSNP